MMRVIFALVALSLAGCSMLPGWVPLVETDAERAQEALAKECPHEAVRDAMKAQKLVGGLQVGISTIQDLRPLGKPVRTVKLVRPGGREVAVNFYKINVVGCRYMNAAEPHFPVIFDRQGVVMGYGVQTMQTLHGQGWRVAEASWPWQSYDYSYIPLK